MPQTPGNSAARCPHCQADISDTHTPINVHPYPVNAATQRTHPPISKMRDEFEGEEFQHQPMEHRADKLKKTPKQLAGMI